MAADSQSTETVSDMYCRECGMTMEAPGEYHPYAACLMFKQSGSCTTVRANLKAVVEYGYQRAIRDKSNT